MPNSDDDDFLYKDLPEDLPEDLREHMRRFHKPDGFCLYCGQPANQHHPVGPIMVTISTPDDDDRTHEFCEWRCYARWIAEQAGGEFSVGQN
jgi:hypothetical protein